MRVVRHPGSGPLQRGREQRLLDRVLARLELPVPADQRAENLRRAVAQQVLDANVGPHISAPEVCMIARTSIAPKRASGHRFAISTARSSVSTSTIR